MPDREQNLEADIGKMETAVFGTPPEEAPEQGERSEATETVEGQPAKPVQAKATPVPQEEETAEYWKGRFSGMKSHNDSQSLELNQQIASLQKGMTELQERLVNAEALNQSSASVYDGVLTDEQQDILGEDAVTGMKAVTEAAVKAATEPLMKKINALQGKVTKSEEAGAKASYTSARDKFNAELAKHAPANYLDIDKDKDFINVYMMQVANGSTQTNGQLFQDANKRNDYLTVAKFFNEYAESKIDKGAAETLKKKVTPPTTASPSAPSTNDPAKKKNFILQSEIDRFYDTTNRGRWKGTDKERLAMERRIDYAAQHRLIRPG